MLNISLKLLILFCFLPIFTYSYEDVKPFKVNMCNQDCIRKKRALEKEMNEKIKVLIEHFKQQDPLGIPGAPVPDPLGVPDMKKTVALTPVNLKNMKVGGQSKFRFAKIQFDLFRLTMLIEIKIDTLLVLGNYATSGWFSRSSGPFSVNISGVKLTGRSALLINKEGKAYADTIHMDIKFDTIQLNFKNLGTMGFALQGVLNSMGPFIFDGIKPYIIQEINTKALTQINEKLASIPQVFPNSLPALDAMIATLRTVLRYEGYDPLVIANQTKDYIVFRAELHTMKALGLSSFYRYGDIILSLTDNTVNLTFEVRSQRLYMSGFWYFGNSYSNRVGEFELWSKFIQASVTILQPLNLQQKPILSRLKLKLGNIQARSDGTGTMDFISEFLINFFPNILRDDVIKFAEIPIRKMIQTELNKINVEESVLRLLDDRSESIHSEDYVNRTNWDLTLAKYNIDHVQFINSNKDEFNPIVDKIEREWMDD